MAVKKPETIEEEKFCDWVATLKTVLAVKLILSDLMGWPDRTVLFNGHVFFIEFKYGKGELSPQQLHWKRIIEDLGFSYYVCYSSEQAIEITEWKIKNNG